MSTGRGDLKGEVLDVKEEEHAEMMEQSKVATHIEHSLGVIEAIKLYPYAVFWAALFAWSLVSARLSQFCHFLSLRRASHRGLFLIFRLGYGRL